MSISIVITDGTRLLREGLAALLARHDDLTVIGESADATSAARLITALTPDVAIVSVQGLTRGAIDTVRHVASSCEASSTRLLVYAARSDPAMVKELFEAGASACLSRECDSLELVAAVRMIHSGQTYIAAQMARDMLNRIESADSRLPPRGIEGLSDRERETLRRIADGQSTRAIAQAMGVSSKSIETYRRRAMGKLRCNGVAELVKVAVREGLTSVDPTN